MVFVKPIYSAMILLFTVVPFMGMIAFFQFFPIVISLGFAVCGYLQAMLYHRVFNILEGATNKTEEQEVNQIEE